MTNIRTRWWRRAGDPPPRNLAWAPPAAVIATVAGFYFTRDQQRLWPALAVFTLAAVAAAAIDLDVLRIPTALIYWSSQLILIIVLFVGLGSCDARLIVRSYAAAAAVMLWWYLCALLTTGFGLGDVRLGLLIGLTTGAYSVTTAITSVIAASVIGFVFALTHRMRDRSRTHFAFGPCLVFGALIAIWSSHGLN